MEVNPENPRSTGKPTCCRLSDSKQRATKIRFRMRDINCNEPSERELPLRQHFSCFVLVLRSDGILAQLFRATKKLDFCPPAPFLNFGLLNTHSPTVLQKSTAANSPLSQERGRFPLSTGGGRSLSTKSVIFLGGLLTLREV